MRKSLPQGAHANIFLVQGRRNLEEIFPGISSKLIERGAVSSRSGVELLTRDGAVWHPKIDLDFPVLSMTRSLLDDTVRGYLDQNNCVTLRHNMRVDGWAFEGGKLTGMEVGGEQGRQTLAADFVIDATGRGGKSVAWLEAGGFGPVEETTLEIGSGYASALFKKPPGWANEVDSLTLRSSDPDTRGGRIFSVKNNCWIVSLIGRFDQRPSGNPDGLLAFAKSLCEPVIFDWINQGERGSPIRTYKAPVSRWRNHDKLETFPERLQPLGDALAHANPLFGQGMTLASTHVMDLWKLLAERAGAKSGLDGLSTAYFEKVSGFTAGVWKGLANVEFGFRTTKGIRPADIKDRMAYARGLRKLIDQDPAVHKLLLDVSHLILLGHVLTHPDIKARVQNILEVDAGTVA